MSDGVKNSHCLVSARFGGSLALIVFLSSCSAGDEEGSFGDDRAVGEADGFTGVVPSAGNASTGGGSMISSGVGGSDSFGTGGVGSGKPPGDDQYPSCGLELTRITLSQGPQIDLMRDGLLPPGYAVPIQGRKSLLRGFIAPTGSAHPVTAHLGITNGGVTDWQTQSLTIDTISTDAQLDSTFTFELAAQQLGADTTYEFLLTEDAPCSDPAERNRYPAVGAEPLQAKKTGAIRVRVFPITIGNGRSPSAPQSLIDKFASDGHALYPSEEFQVTLESMLSWTDVKIPEKITSQQQADQLAAQWTALVDRLCAYRSTNGAAADEHYFGLIQTNSSRLQSLVVGLAENPSRDSPGLVQASCAVAVSHAGDESFTSETFVHEMAHAHSQSHSPGCEASQPDPSYPHGSNGALGSWGWDARDGALKAPSSNFDFLSYCVPYWVSDFTFGKLSEPVAQITRSSERRRSLSKALYQSVIIGEQGRGSLGSLYSEVLEITSGYPVEVLFGTGELTQVLAQTRVMDDVGALLLRVPVENDWVAIVVDGQRIAR